MSPLNVYRTFKFIYQHPLNSSHKLGALLFFLKWQIGTKILNKEIVIPWVDECSFIAGKGERGLTGNIYGGLMEPEEMLFLLHTLQPCWRFIDVGANVGAYTLLASKVIGANSIAFEPIPKTVEKLKTQIALNGITNKVKVFVAGVANMPGRLYFTNLNSTTNHISTEGLSKNTVEVEMLTLDSVLDEGNDQLFIKIDVEGSEYLVLEGAIKLLQSERVEAIIIELCGAGEAFGHSDLEVHQLLVRHGFHPIKYDFHLKKITLIDGYRNDCPNTIYIRDKQKLQNFATHSSKRILQTPIKINV
jgi:FkbM family methyltransferase